MPDTYKAQNTIELSKMSTASGLAIKGFLKACEHNGPAYLRLYTPGPKRINYELIDGSQSVLDRVGKSLGIIVGPNFLETK